MQESLGHKLRLMRAERGLSLREAARRAGVVKETISDIERGQSHPYDVTLAKLAKVYDVPLEELLEEPALAGKADASETGAGEARPRVRLGQLHPEGGPSVTVEQLRELGFSVNQSQVTVLNQMLAYRAHPTGEIHAYGYVKKKGEPVDFEQVQHMLMPAYLLASGAISEDDLREARAALAEIKETVRGEAS
jgi:transcriptional regulator with XRE-family HTH domain